jgi:hypothetical protein
MVLMCCALASAGTRAQAPAPAPQTAQVFQGTELEQFLARARLGRIRELATGVTAPQRATLERDGVTRDALFKTIDVFRPGLSQVGQITEVDFQDSWQTEIPAYTLDRILGLGMVPATVERTINGRAGSLQLWVESMTSEDGRRKQALRPPDQEAYDRLVLKMYLFDNLIANVDRHLNNILVTKDFELRLIDHSRAFRPTLELREPAQLTRFSRTLLDAIAKLELKDLQKRLRPYLVDRQIAALLKRRDAILALAKTRIAEHGEAAVIYP